MKKATDASAAWQRVFSAGIPRQLLEPLEQVAGALSTLNFADNRDQDVIRAALHLVNARGKHIRSKLTLLGSYCTKGVNKRSISAAVAVQLVHTASLIHDDLIDQDDVRRGRPTVHSKFGNQIAVLAGDLLISKAIEIGSTCGERALSVLARAASNMSLGEAWDFEIQRDSRIVVEGEYFELVGLKTASLMSASCAIGGIVSSASEEEVGRLVECGRHLGYALQLRNDYHDAAGISADGKDVYVDSKRNRPNMVLILGRNCTFQDALNSTRQLNYESVANAQRAARALGEGGEPLAGFAQILSVDEPFYLSRGPHELAV